MPGSDIAGAEGGACFGAGMVCWGDTAGSPSCMVVLLSHATKNQQPFSCSSLSPSRIETLFREIQHHIGGGDMMGSKSVYSQNIEQMSLDAPAAPTVFSHFSLEHRLVVVQADALETCRQLPGETFSLIVTSPPYNLGKSYERQVKLQEYLEWQTTVIRELVRLLKPSGSICWQVGNYVDDGEVFPLDTYFYPVFKKLGLKLRNRIIWHFDHGLHAS